MRRIILLISVLLLSGAWAFAQYGGYGEEHHEHHARRVSVAGCLYGGDGYYTLVDDRGNTFDLTGHIRGLDDIVGHRVRLEGRTWFDEDHPYAMGGNEGEGAPTLHVFRVQHVSRDRCDENEGGGGLNIQIPLPQ